MTTREYEQLVADHYRRKGYSVELGPGSNDYGVDVFARKDKEKLALQAKMYGGTTRKVNRKMVMQLYGAKAYFDCTGAIIVTDGDVMASAREVAAKLRIQFLPLPAERLAEVGLTVPNESCVRAHDSALPSTTGVFAELWKNHVMPLRDQTLTAPDGRTNTVLSVDWSGINRLTSNNKKQFIEIEVFRQAVDRIFTNGVVTREEINQEDEGRASSGVVLILAQVPLFFYLGNPSRIVLRQPTSTPTE